VEPPVFLFASIKNKIAADDVVLDNQLKSLFNHSVTPPPAAVSFGSIMNRIKETDQLQQFKPLKDYEVTPPFSFTRLMEIIRGFTVAVPSISATQGKLISMGNLRKIAAAAAILLVCFVGYFTYKNTTANSAQQNSSVANNNTTPSTNNNIVAPITTDTNTVLPKTSTQIASIVGGNKANTKMMKYGSSSKKGRGDAVDNFSFGTGKEPIVPTELKIGDGNIVIIDNDYLATFASLNETNLPPFLQVEKPVATTITIDDYTDITISENMGAMMKKMYKTKKSGKPTRRARKTKEKLEKWKKADADYFNANSTSNPLDPFDLGNFILSK
jgi:hypothetical protein